MGERAKVILNEYTAKALLQREDLDLDKFYTADLKLFIKVAREEIKELKSKYVYVPKVDYSKEVFALRGIIFKAIERLQDYDLVEHKDKVIEDVFNILRGGDKK